MAGRAIEPDVYILKHGAGGAEVGLQNLQQQAERVEKRMADEEPAEGGIDARPRVKKARWRI